MCNNVVEEHHTSLVTVDNHPLALIVLARDCQTVGVGVGCHHKVGVNLLGKIDGHCHSLGVLGVGRYDCGEITVLYHLLLDTVDVLEAPTTKRRGDEHAAATVDGSIDNLKVFVALYYLGVDDKCLYLVEESVVNILADNLN